MPARHVSQATVERMIAESEQLRRERLRDAPPTKTLNLGPALALGQPIPLLWDGTEYEVRPISYRDGLRLQRIALELQRWGATPATDPEQVEALEKFFGETMAFLRSLVSPTAPASLFADASPWEVGELVGFFFKCQTKQRGRSRLQVERPPLTM